MRKRILILENSGAVTGGLKSIIRSSQYLSTRFEFFFVLPKGSQAAPTITNVGFDLIELPMKEIRRQPFSWLIYLPYLFSNTLRLFRIIKKHRIELVVSNDFYNMLPVTYKLLGGGVKYLCYVRFLPDRFPRSLVAAWMTLHEKYSEKIIAVSNVAFNSLPGSRKTIVVRNELPLEFPGVSNFSFNDSSRTMLYLANYIEGKGQEFALEAFHKMGKPDWKLRFVGGDMGLKKNRDFLEKLKNRSRELGLDASVEWEGFATDIKKEYTNASIVLNFSNSESFSLVCLEAMYFGLPVIATKSGGPEEMIDEGISGLLVPIGNIDAMVSAMTSLTGSHTLRESLGRNAFEIVRKKFSPAATIDKLGELYDKVLH